jgi:hypothetical protein
MAVAVLVEALHGQQVRRAHGRAQATRHHGALLNIHQGTHTGATCAV